MVQFDICEAPDGRGYWLDCQTDLLSHLNTRFVVPLLPKGSGLEAATQLNPLFEIGGETFIMATQFASAVPVSELGRMCGSLQDRRYDILNALDFLLTGA